MVRIVTGPFHPRLESALAEDIQALKSADPFAPLAIVVPSDLLRRRLQRWLCVERGYALFDVQVLTFHQLALRLEEERLFSEGAAEPLFQEFADDFLFAYLLRTLARRAPRDFRTLPLTRLSAGALAALWASLRDLKDATIDPRVVLRGVEEGVFPEADREKLHDLLLLYAAVVETGRALRIGSADDVAAAILPAIPHSQFLHRLRRVCYYGFYDLTQVQLSLLEAIASTVPVSVYFPLSAESGYAFARQFFERYLTLNLPAPVGPTEGAEAGSISNGQDGNEAIPVQPHVSIMHAIGDDDELLLACKETLQLVETHGYRFDEIGIVARTLEPYRPALRRVFDQHRIPFHTSAVWPILQEPAVKILMQFARLPLTNFFWRDVLDIVGSPYYRAEPPGTRGLEVHPEWWQAAVRAIGIVRGEDHWARLDRVAEPGPVSEETGGNREPSMDGFLNGDPRHLGHLAKLVQAMMTDCRALPPQGEIGDLTEAFLAVARRHLSLPGLMEETGDEPGTDAPLAEGVRAALAKMRQLGRVGGSVSWEEWVELLEQAFAACAVPLREQNGRGVWVLDAMSARGLPFRALFLLGMNENRFPRIIREDAFLLDRHRRILEEVFGYKIDQKLAGYDEEHLLFTLLTQAARQRLYLVYQRADPAGRPLAPSAYLDEVQPAWSGQKPVPQLGLPRRLSDRVSIPLFGKDMLTPEEIGIMLVLQGYHPRTTLAATGRKEWLFEAVRAGLAAMERPSGRAGPFDGLVGRDDERWHRQRVKGFAPTSLERFAQCPFRYWAEHVLRVRDIRPIQEGPPSVAIIGILCHRVLEAVYRRLLATRWPEEALSRDHLGSVIASTVEAALSAFRRRYAGGYALVWEVVRQTLSQVAEAMVLEDEEVYRREGFHPVAVEVDAEHSDLLRSGSGEPILVRGRLDRIDFRDDPPAFRIIDYKFRPSGAMKSEDKDLSRSALRARYLQPPLYVQMTTFHGLHPDVGEVGRDPRVEAVEFRYLAPKWDPPISWARFDRGVLQGRYARSLTRTLRLLLDGLQAGRFPILPGEYCGHCAYLGACRRFHDPTWWRATRDGYAQRLRRLRKQEVDDA